MAELAGFVKFGAYALIAFSVIAAIICVTVRNVFHSALALAAVLLGVAGIYLALHAEFLAMVQILVYVGAVATLIIFAIMLTQRLADETLEHANKQSPVVLAAGLGLFVILTKLILATPWPIKASALEAEFSSQSLGYSLMTLYVFPFEVVGIVLFAALIGAIVVARKDPAE